MKRRGVLEDPSVRLVRADVIEAWARHLYVVQNLPGYTSSVRRAILGECDDGRAAYVEYWRVGWRLWQTTQWAGPVAELGLPRPVPRGFEIARGLRMYRVRERSMVLRVNGVDGSCPSRARSCPKQDTASSRRHAGHPRGAERRHDRGLDHDGRPPAQAGKHRARGNRRRHALASSSRKSCGTTA